MSVKEHTILSGLFFEIASDLKLRSNRATQAQLNLLNTRKWGL